MSNRSRGMVSIARLPAAGCAPRRFTCTGPISIFPLRAGESAVLKVNDLVGPPVDRFDRLSRLAHFLRGESLAGDLSSVAE